MSRKPESTFIAAVHKHLPPTLHVEKMANPYRGGTADCWYSGKRADIWIEYKFIERVPKEVNIVVGLSKLQTEWLNRRHSEGRDVAVVVGSKGGGVVLQNLAWNKPLSPIQYSAELKTRSELAKWIVEKVEVRNDKVRSRNLPSSGRAA